ncbi:unnamed protein product, partial [Discosporangium mesarthrocarpum]
MPLKKVQEEQTLLTELEAEWINQFWVQGPRHAALHPWWRGPMALILATWRELERRSAETVFLLCNTANSPRVGGTGQGVTGFRGPRAATRAFATVLLALEERKLLREKWDARFSDRVYQSLPPHSTPEAPNLWLATGKGAVAGVAPTKGGWGLGWDDVGEATPAPLLPKDLGSVIAQLRKAYINTCRILHRGKKADSGRAIMAGAASNWELLQAQGQGGAGR